MNEGKKERVFLDTSTLLTAVADEYSDSGQLLQLIKDGHMVGLISQVILCECHKKLEAHPNLKNRFDELVTYLEKVIVPHENLHRYSTIKDPNDRHVLAGAEIGCVDYLVTLDWKHFLSASARKRLTGYPIKIVFPGVLTSSFHQNKLPRISIGTTVGTFAIGVEPLWTSKAVEHAGHPFFVLDLPGVFGVWYEPNKHRFKMSMEVYEPPESITSPRYINESDAFLCVVSWSVGTGFIWALDDKSKTVRKRWNRVPLGSSRLWVGSDRNGANQINGRIVFHGWPRVLDEREIQRVLEGRYVLLPEKPASL